MDQHITCKHAHYMYEWIQQGHCSACFGHRDCIILRERERERERERANMHCKDSACTGSFDMGIAPSESQKPVCIN